MLEEYKIGELIYNLNPMGDQNVDCDGMAVGKPFHYSFDQIAEFEIDYFNEILNTARQIIKLIRSGG